MTSTIKLTKLSKKFGKKLAVDNVSLAVESGEIFGFLGPNGAGKTTVIRLMMGFITPTHGRIAIMSASPQSTKAHAEVGFISADAELYPQWNALQHIKYVENIRDQQTYALDIAERLNLDTQTKYNKLSSGNKQKLGLALALMHDPKILILDEPTRGLDPLLQQELYKILREFKQKGGTVFMSSHNLTEVEHVCDRVGIIREGKLVANETMQSLRRMHIHEAHVVFSSQYIPSVFEKPNIIIVNSTKRELTCHIKGDLNQFLSIIAKHRVTDIQISHLTLEDMFMRYYQ